MKLFYVLIFTLISHFIHAQINHEKILNRVKTLNSNYTRNVYKYDDQSNTIYYQIFFLDNESYKVYTHFKTADLIFEDALKKLYSKGVLKTITDLGVADVKILIKNETTDEVLLSKFINLGVARVGELPTLREGS